jgi:NADH-quinone oxidoreductase subunit C
LSDQPVGQPAHAPELSGVAAETGETTEVGESGELSPAAELISASSPRPYGGYFDDVTDALITAYPGLSDAVERSILDRGELTLHIKREKLRELAQLLRDDETLRFEMLSSVSGVHYPLDTDRELHAIYQITSLTHNRRIRLEVSAPDSDPHIPSVVAVWPTADFQERETWDLFGIIFDGHPALTRIMMPDDWPGHPQRKDYPLGGIPVEYKGATIPPPEERRQYA